MQSRGWCLVTRPSEPSLPEAVVVVAGRYVVGGFRVERVRSGWWVVRDDGGRCLARRETLDDCRAWVAALGGVVRGSGGGCG